MGFAADEVRRFSTADAHPFVKDTDLLIRVREDVAGCAKPCYLGC